MLAPGDIPVGYANKSGTILNLLVRDDLGKSGDPNSMNYEVSYGCDSLAGEYVVNAMLYCSHDHKYPVSVRTKASAQNEQGQVPELAAPLIAS